MVSRHSSLGVAALVALALVACEGTAPNPRSGYTLQLTLDSRFNSSIAITAVRITLDSVIGGPSLNLQPGPGESITVGGVAITSLRTDSDGDGEVEVVYNIAQNPWASAGRFDFPLKSPGYATAGFLLRVEALAATGVVARTTVERTPDGRSLDFDLGAPVDIPSTVACLEGISCTGTTDGGVTDGGVTDGGTSTTIPVLVVARDSDGNGSEETLAFVNPGADGGVTTIGPMPDVVGFRDLQWSPDGTKVYFLAEKSGAVHVEAVFLDANGQITGALSLPLVGSFDRMVLSKAGNLVAARTPGDGGATWLVRPTDGTDGGVDLNTTASASPTFSPSGASVAFASPADGGTDIKVSGSASGDPRMILALTSVTSFLFSPLGGHLAIVGSRSSDALAGLYLASIGSEPLVKVTTEPMAGPVRDIQFSTDGSRLGFRADLDTPGAVELYVAQPGLLNVSGGVATGGSGVGQWAFDPSDGGLVAFIADRRSAGLAELYRTGVSGPPQRVSADGLTGVASFAIGGTGGRLAYRTSAGNLHVVRPGSTPLDLGAADAFSWSPDEQWLAVARSGQLFIIAADGSQTLGPLTTGLVQNRFLWRPTP